MRLWEHYVSEWNERLLVSCSLQLFKQIRATISLLSYLEKLANVEYRKAISKIRLSSHNRHTEMGRHKQI